VVRLSATLDHQRVQLARFLRRAPSRPDHIGRCVAPIYLYARAVTDISISPDLPMPPAQPRPVRHLLETRDSEVALDGYYRMSPGDIVDSGGNYVDPGSVICADCVRAAEVS